MTGTQSRRNRSLRRWLVRGTAVVVVSAVVGGVLLAGPFRSHWRSWRAGLDLRRAQTAVERGDWPEAQLLVRAALRRNPASAEAWQCYARVLRELKDPGELPARLAGWDAGGEAGSAEELLRLARSVPRGAPVAREVLARLPGMVSRHGTNAALLCEAGCFTARHSNVAEGAALIRRAVALDPGERRYQIELASLQAASGRPAVRAAAQDQLRALRDDPASGHDAARVLARSLMTDQPEAAAAAWAEARARTNDWRMMVGWLDSQMRLGTNPGLAAVQEAFAGATNTAQWFAVLQRAAALGPEPLQRMVDQLPPGEASAPAVLQLQVRTLTEAGRHQEALDQAEVALQRKDLSAEALTFLRTMQVRCYSRIGDGEQARAALKLAVEGGAAQPAAGMTAGDQFMLWQMPDAARAMFEVVAARGDARAKERLALLEVQAPRMRAAAWLEEGRCAEASALVREQLLRTDLDPDLRAVLAGIEVLCQQELKQPGKQDEALAWVAGQASAAPATVLDIGRSLVAKGMTNLAAPVLSAVAMTTDPASADAARQMIRLAEEARDGAGMKRWAERVMLADPRDRNARHIVAMVGLLQGPDTNAVAIATQMHQRATQDVTLASTYALALWRSGRNEEALAVLNTLPPGQRRLPSNRLRRGLVLEALGRTNDARWMVREVRPTMLLREAEPLLEELQAP